MHLVPCKNSIHDLIQKGLWYKSPNTVHLSKVSSEKIKQLREKVHLQYESECQSKQLKQEQYIFYWSEEERFDREMDIACCQWYRRQRLGYTEDPPWVHLPKHLEPEWTPWQDGHVCEEDDSDEEVEDNMEFYPTEDEENDDF